MSKTLTKLGDWNRLVKLLEERRRADPDDQALIREHVNVLISLATIDSREGKTDQALDRLDKAEGLVVKIHAAPERVDFLIAVSDARLDVADLLAERGESDRCKRAAQVNLRMLEALKPLDGARPMIVVGRFRTLTTLGERVSAEALQLSTLESGSFQSKEAEVGYELVRHLGAKAAAQRRSRNRAEAQHIVDRLVDFARLLVLRYPERPASHLAVSDAYSQLCKNAWMVGDRTAIEQNLVLASKAALQATVLDPKNDGARRVAETFQQRLADLRHPQ